MSPDTRMVEATWETVTTPPSPESSTPETVPRLVTVLLRTQWAALVVFGLLLLLPGRFSDSVFRDVVVGNLVLPLTVVIVVVRGWVVVADRAWTWLLAFGLSLYCAANIYWRAEVLRQASPPFPSAADALFLSFYPFAVLAVLLSMRSRVGRLRPSVLLDGVIGGLAAASATAVVLSPLLGSVRSLDLEIIVAGAYPVADVLLVSMVIGVFSASGGRTGAFYHYFGAGLLTFAVADIAYSYLAANDLYSPGTPLDGLWAVGAALLAFSVWRPGPSPETTATETLASMWVVSISVTVAVGILAAEALTPLPPMVTLLALATLVAACSRTVLAFLRLRDLAGAQQLALTDELTGLANRRALYARCEQALLDRDETEMVGLALLDLDRFKEVNDWMGHQAGDRLLQLVADRLAAALSAFPLDAMVTRLGGDEFAVLVPRAPSADAVVALAEHLGDALDEPFHLTEDMATLHVRVSAGVAVAPSSAQTRTDLMRCADMAMYAAKAARGSGIQVYVPELAVERRDTLRLAEDLHEAVEHDGLTLAYQPQVDRFGAVRGLEALVRWERAGSGPVTPNVFLPVAESHQLMAGVTRSVVKAAARDCALWRSLGFDLTVSVNLSASDLHEGSIVDLMRDTLAEHALPASAFVVEITETNVMVDPERSEQTLHQLAALGVVISVDDYGTGHCSLSYLRRLPVQELKLDQSFVRDIATTPRDQAIMRSSVGLAHSLGMRLVAEGVEDAAAFDLLVSAGCDLAQGWYFSRPMPLDALLEWLGERADPATRSPAPAA